MLTFYPRVLPTLCLFDKAQANKILLLLFSLGGPAPRILTPIIHAFTRVPSRRYGLGEPLAHASLSRVLIETIFLRLVNLKLDAWVCLIGCTNIIFDLNGSAQRSIRPSFCASFDNRRASSFGSTRSRS